MEKKAIPNRFEGKVAFVTGAANGIGLCLVHRLLEEGARVAAVDIEADTLAKEYDGMDNVLQVHCDVAKKSDVDAAVEKAVEHFGQIDVCFSNAGIIGRFGILETSEEMWRHVMDVNLNGMFFVDQAVMKHMVDKGIKGAIVNTSSIASTTVSPNTGAYGPSKAGVSILTKVAALEMAPYGIRVNAVGPGTSVTRITEGTRFNPERCEKFLQNIPAGRFGEPEEAAAVMLFLASDDASYVTGQTIIEDGGFQLF